MQHDGNTLGDVIKEKKRVFRELSFKEKIVFIWDYYKVHIFLGLLCLFCVISLLHHYIFENQDTLVYGMNINVTADSMATEDFPDAYMEYSGADPKELQVFYEGNLFMGDDENIDANTDYASVMKVSSVIAARELDFVICDNYVFRDYEDIAGFYDLKEMLPADLFERLDSEGLIIYGQATNEESADRLDRYAMAIDLTDTDFAASYNLKASDGGTLYFAAIMNSKRIDEVTNVVRYIFGEEYVPVSTTEDTSAD